MKTTKMILYISGILAVLILAGLYLDRTKPLSGLLSSGNGPISGSGLQDYGAAPEFSGISAWINSEPLQIKDLQGKVVLLDFWTYSCINCLRTLPHLTKLYDAYQDKGLVIVGVHTPEFAFEKEKSNVEMAVKQFGIKYPVAQDNDYKTWNAYGNRYWPAEYLIGKDGHLARVHFGEGDYGQTESAVRQLLGLSPSPSSDQPEALGPIGSPEMYFGLSRLQNLSTSQDPSAEPKDYAFPKRLPLNSFALSGRWTFADDKIVASEAGKIRLHFSAGKVFMVASSQAGNITLKIKVDGQLQPEVIVNDSKLYTLFDSSSYGEHEIEIEADGPGLEAFTFTFG